MKFSSKDNLSIIILFIILIIILWRWINTENYVNIDILLPRIIRILSRKQNNWKQYDETKIRLKNKQSDWSEIMCEYQINQHTNVVVFIGISIHRHLVSSVTDMCFDFVSMEFQRKIFPFVVWSHKKSYET